MSWRLPFGSSLLTSLLSSLLPAITLGLVACGGPAKSTGGPNGSGTFGTSSDGTGGSGEGAGGGAGGSTGGAGTAASSGGTSEAAATPPEAIAADLPASIEKMPPFANHAACPKTGGCNLKGLVPDSLKAQIDAKAPIFMWEQTMDRKVALLLPRHSGVDVYAMVLDGEVSVMADDIDKKQKRLWKWNAAQIPGAGVQIYSKEPTRLLLAVAVTSKTETVLSALDALSKSTWSKRPAPVTSVELQAQPDLAWSGGAYHVRLGYPAGTTASSASMETLIASKNAPLKEHTNDKEWEILAIVSGEGELVRKPGGTADGTKMAAGMIAVIAPGVAHAYKPAGTVPLVAVQMYWPPGPEQRFKKLAEESPPPPKP